jgi:hypothetical protein
VEHDPAGTTIDVRMIPPGLYVLEVEFGDGATLHARFVKP